MPRQAGDFRVERFLRFNKRTAMAVKTAYDSINPKDVVVHKADLPIKNKDPQNSKKESMFDYDIIKDKRFTCDKYQLQ